MLAGLVTHADLAILGVLYAAHAPLWLQDAIGVVSFLGSGWIMIAALPAFAIRAFRPLLTWLFGCLVVTSAVVAAAKASIGRIRPCYAVSSVHALLGPGPTDCSFPSGHAAGTFAFALFVATVIGRRSGAAALVLAFAVAAARVALGVHYPSDVLAGAVVGALLGRAAGLLARRSVGGYPASPPMQTPKPAGNELLPD